MVKNLKINALAIGIFFLFIITGIHPAIAVENIDFDENKNDECRCNCENNNIPYFNLQKEYSKIDIYSKILTLISKQNSEIKTYMELNNKGNPPIICASLFLYALTVASWIVDFEHSANHYPEGSLLRYIYQACINHCIRILERIGVIARALNCDWIEKSESNNIILNNDINKI